MYITLRIAPAIVLENGMHGGPSFPAQTPKTSQMPMRNASEVRRPEQTAANLFDSDTLEDCPKGTSRMISLCTPLNAMNSSRRSMCGGITWECCFAPALGARTRERGAGKG